MVDIERRITGLNPAHIAGLRRLSLRASTPSTTTTTTSHLSFTSLSTTVISHLLNSNIQVHTALTPNEFARIEAEFNFSFPPDLRALLSSGLPVDPGFPNWRSPTHIRSLLNIPIASISFQIARNALWPKSWGPKPSNPEISLRVARTALKKAPHLIPLFNHCYIPCNPCLAGNPVFFIDENQIFCCGSDLQDFFQREWVAQTGGGSSNGFSNFSRKPRWVGFWSEVATDHHRRRRNSTSYSGSSVSSSSVSTSSSSSSSPDRYFEISEPKYRLKWVEKYLSHIGTVMKDSGWDESDVKEIVNVSGCSLFEEEFALVDSQAVFDALLLQTDRFSDSLRRAGWSCEEVTEALGFEFWTETKKKKKKQHKEVSAEIVLKMGKLVQPVFL